MNKVVMLSIWACVALGCAKEAPVAQEVASAKPQTAVVEPIKIGVMLAETYLPNYARHSKNAIEMLIEEVNQGGGVKGRPIEVVIRDDRGSPSDALQAAEEMVRREKVSALFVHSTEHVTLALSEFSKRNEIPMFSVWCINNDCTWKDFHPYMFAFDTPEMVVSKIFAEQAAATGIKKWATVAYNMEFGHVMAKGFKKALLEIMPEAEFVDEQWPAYGEADNGAMIQSLKASGAKGVMNVMFGPGLVSYVREARKRDYLDDIYYMNLDLAYPEESILFKDELPEGWLAIGYPGESLDTPEHNRFTRKYTERFGLDVGKSAIDSYTLMQMLVQSLYDADSLAPMDIVKAAENVTVVSPTGEVSFRAIDHRSDRGDWFGLTAFRDGKARMENPVHIDVNALMPPDAWILEQQGRMK